MQSLINTADDMQWLRDVHLPALPARFHSAILFDNQDWPTKIEVYEKKAPLVSDPVVRRQHASQIGRAHV